MSKAALTRTTMLAIASVALPGLALFGVASASGDEPFYGEPSLGAMIIWIGMPCVLIAASLITVGVAIAAAGRKPLWLITTFPLAVGIWFAVETMLIYSDGPRAHYRELTEGYVQPEDRRPATQPTDR